MVPKFFEKQSKLPKEQFNDLFFFDHSLSRHYSQKQNSHWIFATHAAFPAFVTIDLLYSIWFNFQEVKDTNNKLSSHYLKIPLEIVSDLIHSPLFHKVDGNIYEMKSETRQSLLEWLRIIPELGNPRILHLAHFLYAYSFSTTVSNFSDEQQTIQILTARSYIEPKIVLNEIIEGIIYHMNSANSGESPFSPRVDISPDRIRIFLEILTPLNEFHGKEILKGAYSIIENDFREAKDLFDNLPKAEGLDDQLISAIKARINEKVWEQSKIDLGFQETKKYSTQNYSYKWGEDRRRHLSEIYSDLEKRNSAIEPQRNYLVDQISKLDLYEDFSEIFYVNVSRNKEINQLWDAFDDTELSNSKIFFVIGDKMGMPTSLVSRFILEFIHEELDEDLKAISYPQEIDSNLPHFEQWKFSTKLSRSWKKFRKLIEENFKHLLSKNDYNLEDFLEKGIPSSDSNYVFLPITINQSDWSSHAIDFFEKLIDSFYDNSGRKNQNLPVFIFFFVIRFDYLGGEAMKEQQQQILNEISNIVNRYNLKTAIISIDDPTIDIIDLVAWFNRLGEVRQEKIYRVIDTYMFMQKKEEFSKYLETARIRMDHAEILIETILRNRIY